MMSSSTRRTMITLLRLMRAAARALPGNWHPGNQSDSVMTDAPGATDDELRWFGGKFIGESMGQDVLLYVVLAQPRNIERVADMVDELEGYASRWRELRSGMREILIRSNDETAMRRAEYYLARDEWRDRFSSDFYSFEAWCQMRDEELKQSRASAIVSVGTEP